jgi:hypothetical protein
VSIETQPSTWGPITIPSTISSTTAGRRSVGSSPRASGAPSATAATIATPPNETSTNGLLFSALAGGPPRNYDAFGGEPMTMEDLGPFETRRALPARSHAGGAMRPLQAHVPPARPRRMQTGSRADPELRHLRRVHPARHERALTSSVRRSSDVSTPTTRYRYPRTVYPAFFAPHSVSSARSALAHCATRHDSDSTLTLRFHTHTRGWPSARTFLPLALAELEVSKLRPEGARTRRRAAPSNREARDL